MEAKQESTTTHQILIKLLNGKHKALNFTTPIIPIGSLKNRIQNLTLIPSHLQLLTLSNSRVLKESQSLNLDGNRFPVVVHLLLRLRGGKGGFGSLLRGAATKAGQKKTNNFDACRDMNGRRLRHVNAEKTLVQWRAEADERQLERVAEEYIKKKDKETGGKKARRSDAAEKYVAKYREDSAKCMEEVERTVRESLKGVLSGKRKGGVVKGSESDAKKRMKICYARLGKRKVAESDSEDEDDSDDDAEQENEKSIVIDNGTNSDSSKEAERSPDSITGSGLDNVSDKGTSESGSEEERDVVAEENLKSDETRDGCSVHAEAKSIAEVELEVSEERTEQRGRGEFCLEAPAKCGSESRRQDKEVSNGGDSVNIQETVNQLPVTSVSGEEDSILAQGDVGTNSKLVQEETVSTIPEVLNEEKPVDFDEYNTSTELEVLGMERLKTELLARGLKCGGTLQERAARLFLLKTTPLEKLPKKLFAKK